jgi:hypothetical protein
LGGNPVQCPKKVTVEAKHFSPGTGLCAFFKNHSLLLANDVETHGRASMVRVEMPEITAIVLN